MGLSKEIKIKNNIFFPGTAKSFFKISFFSKKKLKKGFLKSAGWTAGCGLAKKACGPRARGLGLSPNPSLVANKTSFQTTQVT